MADRCGAAVACAFAIFLLAPSGAAAQERPSSLEVRVRDTSGLPVPGALIELVHSARGIAIGSLLTGAEGEGRLDLLAPGPGFEIRVSREGFRASRREDLALASGRLTIVELTLRRPDEEAETAEVVAHARPIDPEDTTLAASFDAAAIERLPVIGRSYTGYLTLVPGVTDPDLDGAPNVLGSREQESQYRVDGGDITDPATGTPGRNLDFEVIEELEVTTSGADVSHGRAGGGFVNLVTKSGGNDFEGLARVIYRGSFLSGDATGIGGLETEFDDVTAALTAGGPLSKDRLWYFFSVRRLEATASAPSEDGDLHSSREGWDLFGKLSLAPAPGHALSIQVSADPRDFEGLYETDRSSPESGSDLEQGSLSWVARWTHTPRADLLVEASLSGFSSGISTDPVSDLYHPFTAGLSDTGLFFTDLRAIYPTRECSTDGTAAGFIPNCDPSLGRTSIFQVDLFSGEQTGPAWFSLEDERERFSFRMEATRLVKELAGEHQVSLGAELTYESFEDSSEYNPFFQNAYVPCPTCRGPSGMPIPNAVTGFQILSVPRPAGTEQLVESENAALFVSDDWKPLPNLVLSAGLRLDVEQVDADGYEEFDPGQERRRWVHILESLCEEGLRAVAAGTPGPNTSDVVCSPAFFRPFYGTFARLMLPFDGQTPDWLRKFDTSRDGLFDSGVDLQTDGGLAWHRPMTDFEELRAEPYGIRNVNLSPRFGVGWDPWRDGRTRAFGSWGRYYDRLYAGVASYETATAYHDFVFRPDPFTHRFAPGQLSEDRGTLSIQQVDRDLVTPHADVLTLGIEREILSGWTAGVSFTRRQAFDQPQDVDINHAVCRDLDDETGADPATICRVSPPGSAVVLGDDLFGNPAGTGPNGLVDLYDLNSEFGQVLRVESAESATWKGATLMLRRSHSRGWGLTGSYTWSRATGGGMTFHSSEGNDPGAGREIWVLDVDQRHRVLVHGTATLPLSLDLGWALRWESGVPYSRAQFVADSSDQGNLATRVVYPSGEKNDRRGDDVWLIDARIARHFHFARLSVTAELAAANLLGEEGRLVEGWSESYPGSLQRSGKTMEAGLAIRF